MDDQESGYWPPPEKPLKAALVFVSRTFVPMGTPCFLPCASCSYHIQSDVVLDMGRCILCSCGGYTPYMPKHATGPRATTGGMLIRGAQSPESVLSRSYLLLSHIANDVILGVFSGDVMLCYPEGHHVRYANAHLQTPCCTDSQHE